MLMLGFGFPVMVGMPLRAGLGVRDVQMKRGMGIAVRKRERQQEYQAAEEKRALHRTIRYLRKVGKCGISDSTRPSEGEAGAQHQQNRRGYVAV